MTDEALAALYPFLKSGRKNAGHAREALLASIALKSEDSAEVKRNFFATEGPSVLKAAELMAQAFRARGRMLVMGNGGSSCDAQHVAVEFMHPVTAGRPALPATNLAADTASLTAIANDVGFDRVFARQVDALAREGDLLVGLSTSGESQNLLAAFATAKARNMATIGLAGGDGGAMARSKDVDVCLVVRSSSIHRVQETHVAIYHILWDLVHTLLADSRRELKGKS